VAHLDNPAGRIEAVLVRAEPLVLDGKLSATEGWMRAFDVGESTQLPGRAAEFIEQVAQARQLIKALPEDEGKP
jgi:hypothetical protein